MDVFCGNLILVIFCFSIIVYSSMSILITHVFQYLCVSTSYFCMHLLRFLISSAYYQLLFSFLLYPNINTFVHWCPSIHLYYTSPHCIHAFSLLPLLSFCKHYINLTPGGKRAKMEDWEQWYAKEGECEFFDNSFMDISTEKKLNEAASRSRKK